MMASCLGVRRRAGWVVDNLQLPKQTGCTVLIFQIWNPGTVSQQTYVYLL